MGNANCNIKMLNVKPEITSHGFSIAEGWETTENPWYQIEIPNTFRGKYIIYLCKDDICGVFYGASVYDYDFDRLMSKLAFRTPKAVDWVKNLLESLKAQEIIDFEIENWNVAYD